MNDVPAGRAGRIAALNDELRRTGKRGRIVATAGLTARGDHFMARVVAALRSFSEFTEDNDPYGEHDFGVLTVEGQRVFFKVDYYDLDQRYGSDDPANPDVTTRVLTLMLPEEY